MQNLFTLKSVEADESLEFWNLRNVSDIETPAVEYSVRLSGDSLAAESQVYDWGGRAWPEYFCDLAACWRGWHGEKSIESLEGQLRLSCTCDALGHVAVRVRLAGDFGRRNWRAETTIQLEAGQLEPIAHAAERFFCGTQ